MKNAAANSVRALDPRDCTGCGLCAHVCAFGAICLKPDKEGFLRPVVADNRCTGCGVCTKRCPPANKPVIDGADTTLFAAVHKDEAVVRASSSGGVFSALALAVLTCGGTVFGAAFDDSLRLRHSAADTADDLARLRGSKYLQSDISGVFALIKEKTAAGKPVLFTGTPCQTAAVAGLFPKGVPDTLFLCDIFCHGVPSQKIFDAYLTTLRRQYRSAPKSVAFRDKTEGWQRFSMNIVFQNGAVYRQCFHDDAFMQGFLKNLFLRESCYRCAFKHPFGSDLTIGDFWGGDKADLAFDPLAGLSLVSVNSAKGQALLAACPDLTLTETDAAVAFAENPAVTASVERHPHRDAFCKKITRRNFNKLYSRYLDYYYEPPAKRATNATKRRLLILWNLAVDTKTKAGDALFAAADTVYAQGHTAPRVMTKADTVAYILEHGCSIARFGDGEIKLLVGRDISFQPAQAELSEALAKILRAEQNNLLVCVPDVFDSVAHMTPADGDYWKKHLARYRKHWYTHTRAGSLYGNAFLSRPYMCFSDKEGAGALFEALKALWKDRDVVIAEGEQTRMGVGNDLFANARSVRRVLGPSARAFNKYDALLNALLSVERSALILLALGPTATVLAAALCERGYQALDIGNTDTEYEWFRRGCTRKTPIENKLVYEARDGERIGAVTDEAYLSQVIARIAE